jgi:hypothetical protein
MHFSLKVNVLDSCTYSRTIESWLSKKMLLAIVNVLQNCCRYFWEELKT